MNLDIIKDIPKYKEWTNIIVPQTGWSQDLKYRVQDKNGNYYILRVSDISFLDNKKREYDNIVRLSQHDILMPKPIEFGLSNDGKQVYMLLTWIEGVAVEDVLKNLDSERQYHLGYESGKLLRKLHNYSPAASDINWADTYGKKIDKIIDEYRQSGITINNEQKIIEYINENKYVLNGRSQVIRHGDYHIGNLIITPENKVGVIDFDACSVGDGWEEFGGMVWAVRLSDKFAKGQVDGYFSGDVPDEFFRLLSLYVGIYALEHVVISVRSHKGTRSLETIYSNTDFMSGMFDDYKTHIPNWYR